MGRFAAAHIVDEIGELQRRFSDLLNYEAEDVTSAIDPLTWRSPGGDSCLHYAAMRGDEDSIRMLVKLGVEVNLAGDMGQTALDYARTFGHTDAARALTKLGADQLIRDQFGKPPGE